MRKQVLFELIMVFEHQRVVRIKEDSAVVGTFFGINDLHEGKFVINLGHLDFIFIGDLNP